METIRERLSQFSQMQGSKVIAVGTRTGDFVHLAYSGSSRTWCGCRVASKSPDATLDLPIDRKCVRC